MPKRVDHGERRRLIADALMRVAVDRGLEAVSLRHVATEAGVSAGMVQHYFRTKDEMMTFALSVVRDRGRARVEAAVAALGPDPAPRTLLGTVLTALLPLDDTAREDGRVALAFLSWSALDPAPELRPDTERLAGFVASLLPAGSAPAAAAGLLALTEGLGVHLLGGQCTPGQAAAALDHQLGLLFPADVR